MVAEVDVEKCTGCSLCARVCPTSAFVVRDRLADEPGRSRKIVELDGAACYNAQRCLEICPEDAIRMLELDTPFEVATDRALVDQAELEALCAKAGYPADLAACLCTLTTVGEMAAAVLLGADTPEKVSLATGARTGCSEICMHPLLAVLAAAGHADAPPNPPNGYQWYAKAATLFDNLGPDGSVPDWLEAAYPGFSVRQELADMAKLYAGSDNAADEPIVTPPA
jgi:ferredoxin